MNTPKTRVVESKKEPVKNENIITKLTKIKPSFYGWILAVICFLALLGVSFFSYVSITYVQTTTLQQIEFIKEEAETAKDQLSDYLEIQLLQSRIQNLEDERVRREQFRLTSMNLIRNEQPIDSRRMTPEQMVLFAETIFRLSNEVYKDINVALPLAFARVESVFDPRATGANRNDAGEIFSYDFGLFQFNSSGTAEYVASLIGEPYRRGMEFEIEASVIMWYKYYVYNRTHLQQIRPFETLEEEIKFVAYTYNRGYSRGREAWFYFNRNNHNIDTYLSNLYRNSTNPAARASTYPQDIWNVFNRFSDENEWFSLINF